MKSIGNILIAAGPLFFLETAFEMYFLTLTRGQQMLFFSLVQVAPGLLALVAVSGAAFACLAVFALVVVVVTHLAGAPSVERRYARMMLIILLAQVAHTALLLNI